jgi:hypothetical protein
VNQTDFGDHINPILLGADLSFPFTIIRLFPFRFVFPAPSSSEGLEGELLRAWDEEYLKVNNGVESEV